MLTKAKVLLAVLLVLSLLAVPTLAQEDEEPTQMSLEELRDVEPAEPYKIGFANLHENHVFMWDVRESIERNAEEYGLELIVANNNLDGQTALANADNFVTQGVDGAIEFQSHVEFGEAIMEKFNEIGAPVIAIDIPMPGATFFGANNYQAGFLAGEGAGLYAEANWDGQVDKVISIELPQSGEVVMQRSEGLWEGVQSVVDVPDEDVIHLDGKETQDTARQVTCDALQGIPDAEYIVVVAINDEMALGGLAAVETCGSDANKSHYIGVGQSVDAAAQEAIRTPDSHFIGSTAYFPERYGDYVVPALIRLMNGEELPDALYVDHLFIDASNIDEYYPLEEEEEAQMSLEELRDVEPAEPYKIGFANLHENHVFMWDVREGIERNAEEYGLELIVANNNLDGQTALANADNFVTQGVDGAIEFQSHVEFGEAIMEKFNEIGAPVIAIDIPMPGATFFGANNYTAGFLAGEGAGKYAEANWDGQVDKVISIELPQSGEVVMQRSEGLWEGVQSVVDVPDEDVIHLDGKETQDTARQVTCDALQGIPDAEYIVVVAINDEMALGGLAAVETCGSDANKSHYIGVGQSVDAAAQEAIRDPDSHFIGSTAYFPERYGDYVVPALIRLMNGEELPDALYVDHLFIDASNIDEYYPLEAEE